MNAYRQLTIVVSVAICALAQAIAQDVSDADLINELATSNNLSSDALKVVSRSNLTLPITGVRLTVAKVHDNVNNQWYVSALDQNGKAVDLAAAQFAETLASYQKYGKLDPRVDLAEHSRSATRAAAGRDTGGIRCGTELLPKLASTLHGECPNIRTRHR